MSENEQNIIELKEEIDYLKKEIQKDNCKKYVKQLHDFKNHMGDTFERFMGDDATNESVTEFSDMDFSITWNGKTVTIYSGADVFQTIENMIDCEISDYEEV